MHPYDREDESFRRREGVKGGVAASLTSVFLNGILFALVEASVERDYEANGRPEYAVDYADYRWTVFAVALIVGIVAGFRVREYAWPGTSRPPPWFECFGLPLIGGMVPFLYMLFLRQ